MKDDRRKKESKNIFESAWNAENTKMQEMRKRDAKKKRRLRLC